MVKSQVTKKKEGTKSSLNEFEAYLECNKIFQELMCMLSQYNQCCFPCMIWHRSETISVKATELLPLSSNMECKRKKKKKNINGVRNCNFFFMFPVQIKIYFYIWRAQMFYSQEMGRSQLLIPESSFPLPINCNCIKGEHPHVCSLCVYEFITIKESVGMCIAAFV